MKGIKLNLGSGFKKKEGFTNVDISLECNPDIIADLEQPLPFKDNSVSHIYSEHTFEHIRPMFWKSFLNELQRIAKPNCILEIMVPFDNIRNRTGNDHYRTFSFHPLFECEVDTENAQDRNYFCKLKLKRISQLPNKFYRILSQLFPFICNEVYVKFEIQKGLNKGSE